MPTVATPALQLDLFLRDTAAYQQALARYDMLRPILGFFAYHPSCHAVA